MTQTITAAVLDTPTADFRLERVELEDPRSDEVLIRIEASGICYTDEESRHLVPTPSVLGHEGVGVIERVGAHVTDLVPGQRVVISYPSCGQCPNCHRGRPFHCERGIELSFAGHRLDGTQPLSRAGIPLASAFFQQSSFATHAVTLARDVVAVDGTVPVEILAALPCGVLTGAGAVLNVLSVKAGDTVAVFGVGAVGLAAVMAARLAGAETIIAIDWHARRLDLARELGATHALEASADPGAALRAIVPNGCSAALDTSGQPAAIRAMLRTLAFGSAAAIVTAPRLRAEDSPLLEELFNRGGTLRSIYLGESVPRILIPRLLSWFAAGRFPVDRLISMYPFADINRAFADVRGGRTIKPILMMP